MESAIWDGVSTLGRDSYLAKEGFYGREVVFGYVLSWGLEVVPGPPLNHSYEA